MQKIPIGKSDFKSVIEDGFYYVDKTDFITEIIDSSAKVILLPRPRRFGKTLNLAMLNYFTRSHFPSGNAYNQTQSKTTIK